LKASATTGASRTATERTTAVEPVARFVTFAPAHLITPGPEVDAWFRRNLPRGVTPAEAVALPARDAERLRRDYSRTLVAIATARLPVSKALNLAHCIVRDGERARAWQAAGCPDPAAHARAADAAFLEKLEGVRNAARRLAQHFEEPGAPIGFALAAAGLRLQEEGARIVAPTDEAGEVDMPATLARFLRIYAETLETLHHAKRGPMLHLFVAAPFIFQNPIDGSPPWGDMVKRGLLWRATYHARRFTGGTGSRSMGAPMWKGGRALWNVAAALVHDVTGEECSADAAQDALAAFIRRNPGVGFHEWPQPDPNT